jgi:hypothetical protein
MSSPATTEYAAGARQLTERELLELQDDLYDAIGLLVKIRDRSDDSRAVMLATLAGRHVWQVNSYLESMRLASVPPGKRMGPGRRRELVGAAS